ncbi:MFS transporter [Actinokineospora auranticolor]|uniref:Putative MFS family arabinose efflux permease n=1 Tax=Actinokineospora auranticolor TaxID=155976 RepID=A0A2S6GJA4_9PSEU|nr:MFS transporter [Actinokineospora auranticolor]PPK65297.1 putative MFS family arabinose efflux permease [Actinokineospora auranticolor]
MGTWRLVFAAVCAVAVAGIYAAQPLLPLVGADLGVARAHLGWVVAAGQVGYLVGLVVLVPLGDVVDRRVLLVGHLGMTAVGALVVASAARAWVLFGGLVVVGLFAVVVQTAVAYAASLSAPGERGRTLGVVTSGVVIGILGARVVAGAVAGVWGWRGVYVVLAVLLVALAAVVWRVLPPDPRVGRDGYRRVLVSLGGLFGERLFVSRGLIAFFLFASFGALWGGLALPLAGAPWWLSPAQIGLFGVAGLAGAVGAARSGRWADGGLAGAVTGGGLVVLVVSWWAIGQVSLWWLVVGVVVLDFAVQVVHVSNQHLLTAAHPERTSSVVGGYMVFYSLGSALGAAATTAAFDATGWVGSNALGAGFAVCGLVVWVWARRVAL